MHTAPGPAHVLVGISAAATEFVGALEANRRRIAEEAGLTATELRALFHVARVVSITPRDLARHLELTTGAVTAVARSLVDEGLLQRIDHPDDRRSLYLELTEAGHAQVGRIHTGFDTMMAESTAGLDDEDLERFARLLRQVGHEVRDRVDRPQRA